MAKESAKEHEGHMEEKTIYSWESPDRPFKKKTQKYYKNLWILLGILALLALFLKEFFLIFLLASVGFLFYVLGTTPPKKTSHKITNYSIYIGGQEYLWEELTSFWFKDIDGYLVLHLDTKRFPGRTFAIIGKEQKGKIAGLIHAHDVAFEKSPKEDFLDKLTLSLSRRFSLGQ